jgi:hypothetical protein
MIGLFRIAYHWTLLDVSMAFTYYFRIFGFNYGSVNRSDLRVGPGEGVEVRARPLILRFRWRARYSGWLVRRFPQLNYCESCD